jgi:virulence-associated protein VapD
MKIVERRQFKAINFDLIIKKLVEEFGQGKHLRAYAQVRRFLEKNGFEHRQWSGYRSKSTMTYTELLDVCMRLFAQFPWLGRCANRFDVTNIGREYDMLGIVKEQIPEAEAGVDIEFDPLLD